MHEGGGVGNGCGELLRVIVEEMCGGGEGGGEVCVPGPGVSSHDIKKQCII